MTRAPCKPCPECEGDGHLLCGWCSGTGESPSFRGSACSTCDGTGGAPCVACDETGVIPITLEAEEADELEELADMSGDDMLTEQSKEETEHADQS